MPQDLMRLAILTVLLLALACPNPVWADDVQSDEATSRWTGLGIAAGTAGLMLLAGAAAYASGAASDEDALREASQSNQVWSDALDEQHDRGDRRATTARVLGGVGAAALVGGVAAYLFGKNETKGVHFAPMPNADTSSPSLGLSMGFEY